MTDAPMRFTIHERHMPDYSTQYFTSRIPCDETYEECGNDPFPLLTKTYLYHRGRMLGRVSKMHMDRANSAITVEIER